MDFNLGNIIKSENKNIEYTINKTDKNRYFTDVIIGKNEDDLYCHKLFCYGIVIGDLLTILQNPNISEEEKTKIGEFTIWLYKIHNIVEENFEAQNDIINKLLNDEE